MTTQDISQAVISTDRFALRSLQTSDLGLLELYLGDQRVALMTRSIPHPLPPEYVANRIERAHDQDRANDYFVIDGSAFKHPEVMGVLKLTRLDRDQSELRYWVAPAFWNLGVATDAVGAILQANPHGARDIYAEVFQDNPKSARVLTNAGFAYLGDAETFSVARGAVVPTWTYARKMAPAAS